MITGFYLISSTKNDDKSISKKRREMEMLTNLYDDVDMELVFFEDIIPVASSESNGKIFLKDKEIKCPDFVFAGDYNVGENQYHLKAVLDMFEGFGVPCFNPSETKEKTDDKLWTFQIAKSVCNHVKIPKTILVTPEITTSKIGEIIGFPLVIKVIHGSEGRGISLISSEKELDNLLSMIFAAPFNDYIIAQEAIMTSKGRDLRVVIFNGEIVDSFVRNNPNDFRSNISAGGNIEGVNIPEKIKEDSLKIVKEFNLQFGSIDFLFGENNEFYLCEVNSDVDIEVFSKKIIN